jgi:hypothetical protein
MNPCYVWIALLYASTILPAAADDGNAEPAQAACSGQITYKSDTDDAYKYLESQQRDIYTQNPNLADPYSRAQLNSPRAAATFAQLKAIASKACPDPTRRSTCALDPVMVDRMEQELACLTLPTRFESPFVFSLINIEADELNKIRLKLYPNSPETKFGSLPTGTIDAQAILPPKSAEPLVIVNRDIFFFTGALSKSIVDAIPIIQGKWVELDTSQQGLRKRLHDHPYIVHNFADAMSRLVRGGSSAGAIEVTLDEDHNHLHARLVGGMDMFLIAHEEAHVILGHTSEQGVQFQLAGSHRRTPPIPVSHRQNLILVPGSPAGGTTTTLTAEMRTREQELAADALGFKLLIWSLEEEGDPISVMVAAAAPQMVFRVLDAANSFGAEAGGWTFSDANHPVAADRIKALDPVFADMAKFSEPLKEADFRVAFDASFKELLAEADPLIRQNLGLPPKSPK